MLDMYMLDDDIVLIDMICDDVVLLYEHDFCCWRMSM